MKSIKVPNASYKRKQRKQKPYWMDSVFRIALPILGVMLVIGIILDAQMLRKKIKQGGGRENEARIVADLQRLTLGLTAPRYEIEQKGTSIVPPAGWSIDKNGNNGYFDVTFRGPQGLDLSISATSVNYDDFAKLLREIEKIEINIGLHTHIEKIDFCGHPAIFRTCELMEKKLFIIDFLENRTAHHLIFSAPRELYERYLPVIKETMKSYQP